MVKTVTSRFVLKGDNQLNTAFGKAKQQLSALSKQAALFGAVAVAGAIRIVSSQAKQIDILAKTSDALRITTESLQTLDTMAELAGIGAEDFNKKLGKMVKTIGEIARKGGEMALALEDAGLNIQDVINLPADEQFEAVAKALAGISNQAIRASIANDLFGRDAAKLLALTDQLAKDGLGPMRKELEALGFLISRSEAAGVERMNDSMEIASKVGAGLAQQFTVQLAPAIAAIAEAFTDAAKESGGFKDQVADVVEGTIRTLAFLADTISGVRREFGILANVGIIAFESLKVGISGIADSIINGPNRAIDLLLRKLGGLGDVPFFGSLKGIDELQFGDVTSAFKSDLDVSKGIIAEALAEIESILLKPLPSTGLEERLKKIRESLDNFKQDVPDPSSGGLIILPEEEQRLAKVQSLLDGMLQQVREFGATAGDKALFTLIDAGATEDKIGEARLILDELRLLEEGAERIKQASEDRNALEQEYASLIEATRTPIEVQAEVLNRINALYESGIIPSTEQYAEILGRVNQKFLESQEKVSELNEFTVQAARSMQTAFADFLFDPFDKGLGGMLKSFGNFIRQAAAQAAASAILSSLFGGLAGSSNSFFAAFGKQFIGGKAAGGPFSAGDSFIAGERGPELVVAGTAGTVIPNNKMGSSIVVNINAPGADAGTFARLREIARAEIVPQAIQGATRNTMAALSRPRFA